MFEWQNHKIAVKLVFTRVCKGSDKSNKVLEKVVFVQESSKVPRDKLKKAAAVGGSVRWWFGSQGPAPAPDQVDRHTPRPLYIYTITLVFNPLTTLKIKRGHKDIIYIAYGIQA